MPKNLALFLALFLAANGPALAQDVPKIEIIGPASGPFTSTLPDKLMNLCRTSGLACSVHDASTPESVVLVTDALVGTGTPKALIVIPIGPETNVAAKIASAASIPTIVVEDGKVATFFDGTIGPNQPDAAKERLPDIFKKIDLHGLGLTPDNEIMTCTPGACPCTKGCSKLCCSGAIFGSGR